MPPPSRMPDQEVTIASIAGRVGRARKALRTALPQIAAGARRYISVFVATGNELCERKAACGMALQLAEIYLCGIFVQAEVFAQGFTKLQANPPQPRLHRRLTHVQNCRGLINRETLDIAQDKHSARDWTHFLQCPEKNVSQLRGPAQLLGIGSPVRDVPGQDVSLVPKILVQ